MWKMVLAEENARLQQPSGRAFAPADKCLKLLALLRTQPHHIPLYRNVLSGHDSLRRSNRGESESSNPFKLFEADD